MKIFVAHSSNFDFINKLYAPLRQSVLNDEYEILLPHETGEEVMTRERIKDCEFLVAEVSAPSFGVGIEMGWANAFAVPIIAISEKGSKVSSSINSVVRHHIEYENSKDMIEKLAIALSKL